MKLIVKTTRPISGERGMTTPRDIRNLCGSIAPERTKEIVMWHQSATPHLIYTKASRNSFAIVTYTEEGEAALTDLAGRFASLDKGISLNHHQTEVSDVILRPSAYRAPKEGLFRYRITSPLIIAGQKPEFAEAREHWEDEEYIKGFTARVIADNMAKHIEDWFGIDFEPLDLKLVFREFRRFRTPYKEDYFPAVTGEFLSNYSLPDFVGYKIGLGYGELQYKKIEEQGREKPKYRQGPHAGKKEPRHAKS